MRKQRWLAAAVAVALAAGGFVFSGCTGGQENITAETSMDAAQAGRLVVAVEGMSCQGCVEAVTSALQKLPGVESVEVSLEKKQAVVVGDPEHVTAAAVVAAIQQTGYQAEPAKPGNSGAQ